MNAIWTWKLQPDEGAARRLLLLRVGIAVVALIAVVWVVAASSSGSGGSIAYPVIVGVALVGILVMEEMATRRALSAEMSVDSAGVLTVRNSSDSSTVDLSRASEPAVKLRSGYNNSHRWAVEMDTPDGAWHWDIGRLAFKNIDRDVMEELEGELRRLSRRFRASAAPGSAGHAAPGGSGGTSESPLAGSGETLVWTIPLSPNAERNRRRLRIGLWGTALVLAVILAAANWSQGLGRVAMTMFVPVLLALIGFGLDRLYTVGRKFRIEVRDGTLKATNGARTVLEVPSESVRSVSVGTIHTYLYSGTAHTRATNWMVAVDVGEQEPSKVGIPSGFGLGMNRDHAISLEARLRSALGLESSRR